MSKLRQAEAISDLDSADDVNLKKRKRHHERTANLGLTELSPKSSKKNVHNLDVTHDYSLPNFPNICSAINNEFIRSLETTAVSPSHNLSLNQSMSNYDIEKEIKPKNCDHTGNFYIVIWTSLHVLNKSHFQNGKKKLIENLQKQI